MLTYATEAALLRTLGPAGAGVITTADETYVAPSDGTVRAKRVTRLLALVLQVLYEVKQQ
jgi:hypothetical protein